MKVDADDAPRCERLRQQAKRNALAAANVDDRGKYGQGTVDESFEVVDGNAQNVVFPRMGAQEPDAKRRFSDECHAGCFGILHN